MCASCVTTTSSASDDASTSAATAASDDTGTICRPAPWASPCATDAAMRMPMNEPGPLPSTMASRPVTATPASASAARIIGTSRRVCSLSCSSWRSTTASPTRTATEQASEDVSIASNFMPRPPGSRERRGMPRPRHVNRSRASVPAPAGTYCHNACRRCGDRTAPRHRNRFRRAAGDPPPA